jgi:predicted transcriptional regulator
MRKPPSRKKGKTETVVEEKLVALTVKIDNEMYVRLSLLRARERKTAQEILTEALTAYLDRPEARK